MYFIRYTHYVTFLYCFHLLELGSAEKSRALVITKENDEFKLTIPDSYIPGTKESTFTIPKNGKIHFFCESGKKINQNRYLEAIKKKPNSKFNDLDKCHTSAIPVFVKVKNPQDLKHNVWDTQRMELYHSGYLLSTNLPGEKQSKPDTIEMKKIKYNDWGTTSFSSDNDFKEGQTQPDSAKKKPEYNGWKGPDYELLVEIEAYYDKAVKQVVAAEYTLFSTNLPFHKQFVDMEYIATIGRNKMDVPRIMIYADRLEYSYLDMFENKLSENWTKTLEDARKDNYLSKTFFASNLHFPIPLWERLTLQSFNVFPMFKKPKEMWQKVQKFSRIVAKYFGDLKVKTGITDTMTLSGTKFVDTERFPFPKYFWNIYEYHDGNEALGIIVVLNYNPFEKTDENICETQDKCNDFGWMVGNNDFNEGEIYCCGMTGENIRKLKVNFMALKEKPIFNLHKWEDKMGRIKMELNEISNQEIKKHEDTNIIIN